MAETADPPSIDSSTSPRSCENCGKEATLRCSRCTTVVYCNTDCQKAHWKVHNRLCFLEPAKIVARAAEVFQKAWFAYREGAFLTSVGKVEQKGSRLIFHTKPGDIKNCINGCFYRLPNELFKNNEDKHAVLTYMTCDHALAHANALIATLLHRIDSVEKVEEVSAQLNATPRTTVPCYPNGNLIEVPVYFHSFLRVTLSNGIAYVVDPTGAQYGQLRACMLWEEFQNRYIELLVASHPFGHRKRMILMKAEKSKEGYGWFARVASEGWDAFNKGIDEWSITSRLTPSKLLQLPEKKYASETRKILETATKSLETHVQGSDYRKEQKKAANWFQSDDGPDAESMRQLVRMTMCPERKSQSQKGNSVLELEALVKQFWRPTGDPSKEGEQ